MDKIYKQNCLKEAMIQKLYQRTKIRIFTESKCLAFHSYKGGTGKSTISFNLSAQMVKRGLKVLLLDLDVYAPSLQTYPGH